MRLLSFGSDPFSFHVVYVRLRDKNHRKALFRDQHIIILAPKAGPSGQVDMGGCRQIRFGLYWFPLCVVRFRLWRV